MLSAYPAWYSSFLASNRVYPIQNVFGFMVCRKPLRGEGQDVFGWGLSLLVLVQQYFNQTRCNLYRKDRGFWSSSSTVQSFPEEFVRIGILHLLEEDGNVVRWTPPQRSYGRRGHRHWEKLHCWIIV